MTIIDYTTLDYICMTVKAGNPHYFADSAMWCTDLYYTGCRPNEITDPSLWSYDGIGTYTLNPLKGNDPRYFGLTVLSGGLKGAIGGSANYYSRGTYSQIKNVFRTTTPLPQIYHDNKPMDLYLFRYRYVKYLGLIGWSNAAIQAHMGWVEAAMVDTYLLADLYYL